MRVSLFAYIDPGSGGFLLQAVVGGVAAAFVLVRAYWHRSVNFFRGRKSSNQ